MVCLMESYKHCYKKDKLTVSVAASQKKAPSVTINYGDLLERAKIN